MLTDKETARLIKLLGMMGSSFDGERANAAAKANELVRGAGLTWEQYLTGGRSLQAPRPDPSPQATARRKFSFEEGREPFAFVGIIVHESPKAILRRSRRRGDLDSEIPNHRPTAPQGQSFGAYLRHPQMARRRQRITGMEQRLMRITPIVLGLLTATPVQAEPPSQDLVLALKVWAGLRADLPITSAVPKIVLTDRCEMAQMVRLSHCDEMIVHGIYDGNGTIHLQPTWRPDNILDLSFLVHELVHFLQHHAGVQPGPCPKETYELPAYSVQMDFVAFLGVEPFGAFNMTWQDFEARTKCKGME